jgi:XTP/dITP diphosphohydrolase
MAQRRQTLLDALGDTPPEQRSAHFACVIALARPNTDALEITRGTCPGHIALAEVDGDAGFGYDAIFIPQGHDRSWSQIAMAEKNRISHRGQAARAMIPLLQKLAGEV